MNASSLSETPLRSVIRHEAQAIRGKWIWLVVLGIAQQYVLWNQGVRKKKKKKILLLQNAEGLRLGNGDRQLHRLLATYNPHWLNAILSHIESFNVYFGCTRF